MVVLDVLRTFVVEAISVCGKKLWVDINGPRVLICRHEMLIMIVESSKQKELGSHLLCLQVRLNSFQ